MEVFILAKGRDFYWVLLKDFLVEVLEVLDLKEIMCFACLGKCLGERWYGHV